MYSHRSSTGPVDLAFTDRYGGVSAVPFDSLNLALEGDDDPEATAENLRRVVADFAPDLRSDHHLAQMRQVHGAHVDVVEDRRSTGIPEADGLVTAQPGVALLVRAADCVPVVLADPGAGVIGVAHAGRQGLVAGIVPQTLAAMRRWGATSVTAWVGPHVCGACYEVPEQLQEEVAAVEPATRATTSWGTPALDLGRGVRAQLEREGAEVVEVGRCTRESEDLYSYRRDGAAAGRLAGLVRIRG